MIRVVLFFVLVGIAAFGAAWLADRPGDVAITWLGWRLDTSVMVLAAGVAAVAVLAVMLWSMVRALLRSPEILRLYLRSRRGVRGYLAVSQGLIAAGSGDARAARKFADEARRIAPDEPLTLLLTAQAAQLAGDRAAAEHTFQIMAGRDDTRLLGLHGLFVEAQRCADLPSARRYAEAAAERATAPAWAGRAVLEFRCAAGDWNGALERLERNMKSGHVDRASYRRQRAVLLTAQALAEDHAHNGAQALTLALEAVKLAPALVPAAALAGRLLAEAGSLRKARRIVEAAWKANPHPDLAETYAHLQPGASARDRLKRIQALAQTTPDHIEGALAVARAALDAQEFTAAREVLAPLLTAPTRRVAMLMADLAQMEHGDEGRAREWMTRAVAARRDPAWTADGYVSDHWMPVSPVTGRLDAFQWKDPLAGIGADGAVIENDKAARALIDALPASAAPAGEQQPMAAKLSDTTTATAFPEPPSAHRNGPNGRPTVPVAPSVIPLMPVPDDPGPEPELPAETGAPSESSNDSWRKLRGLFK
jgi:HemY protein